MNEERAIEISRGELVSMETKKWNLALSAADLRDKYKLMAASPLGFFRGTNHLFWQDFATDARIQRFGDEKTVTFIQGDLHTDNFAAFNINENQLVYGLTDFDDSVIADYQYDLWRMSTSIALICQDQGIPEAVLSSSIDRLVESYLEATRLLAESGYKKVNKRMLNPQGELKKFLHDLKSGRDDKGVLKKWTNISDGKRRFDIVGSNGKLAIVTPDKREEITQGIETQNGQEGYFKMLDVAKRLSAGVGSYGVPRYYVLIEGLKRNSKDDQILEIKRQSLPAPYGFLTPEGQALFTNFRNQYGDNFGKWYQDASRAMTIYKDNHLSWIKLPDGYYSVQSRAHPKEKFPVSRINQNSLLDLAGFWGAAAAVAHSGGKKEFSEHISENLEGRTDEFKDLVRSIALEYAQKSMEDYRNFVKQINSGS